MISCICLTYNRIPDYQYLLEEVVESFCRQDYPNRELIIVNDTPNQLLRCYAPKVRLINCPFRIPSLGEKYNIAIRLAKGKYIAPWEDDDISLPWRLSQSRELIGAFDYWKPPQVVFLPQGSNPVFQHPIGFRHHASLFKKQAWMIVNGYPHVSGPQDAMMDQKLLSQFAFQESTLTPDQWAYIYRWGVSDNHLSSNPDPETAYRAWGERPIIPGVFEIVPKWLKDYTKLVREEWEKQNRICPKITPSL